MGSRRTALGAIAATLALVHLLRRPCPSAPPLPSGRAALRLQSTVATARVSQRARLRRAPPPTGGSVPRVYFYDAAPALKLLTAAQRQTYDALLAAESGDAEYPERWLSTQLRHYALETSSAADADVLVVPLWSWAFCRAAGQVWDTWEDRKRGLFTPCEAYLRYLAWVAAQPSFAARGPQRHALYVGWPARWRDLKRVATSADDPRRAGGRSGKYWNGRPATAAERRLLQTLVSTATILTFEDPEPAQSPSPNVVSVPYFAQRRRWWLEGAPPHSKPLLVTFGGGTLLNSLANVWEVCPSCPLLSPTELRQQLVRLLCAGEPNAWSKAAPCGAWRPEVGWVSAPATHNSGDDAEGSGDGKWQLALASAYKRSRFCLVPRGDTRSSKRLVSAIMALCVPVVISDGYPLPLSATVDYAAFVISLPEWQLFDAEFRLVEFLKAISAQRLQRMQAALLVARRQLLYCESVEDCPEQNAGATLLSTLLSRLT